MMETLNPQGRLVPTLDDVIARHGAWRVLVVAAGALLNVRRRRPPPMDVSQLSDHMRRDIGLEPGRITSQPWLL